MINFNQKCKNPLNICACLIEFLAPVQQNFDVFLRDFLMLLYQLGDSETTFNHFGSEHLGRKTDLLVQIR